jgi:hypothetical protein
MALGGRHIPDVSRVPYIYTSLLLTKQERLQGQSPPLMPIHHISYFATPFPLTFSIYKSRTHTGHSLHASASVPT